MRSRGGFTLIEMIVSVALVSFIGLWAVDWVRKPAILQQMMMNADNQKQLTSALTIFMNDLSEADASSIPWSQLPPTSTGAASSISFWKFTYDLAHPGSVGQTTYQYQFQPNGTGTGSLVRSSSNGSTTTSAVVLAPIDPPGVNNVPSLVQADKADPTDAAYNMLVVTVQYHPAGGSPVSVVRRVAVGT